MRAGSGAAGRAARPACVRVEQRRHRPVLDVRTWSIDRSGLLTYCPETPTREEPAQTAEPHTHPSRSAVPHRSVNWARWCSPTPVRQGSRFRLGWRRARGWRSVRGCSPELAEQARHVSFDGGLTHVQGVGEVGVRGAGRERCRDLPLSVSELRQAFGGSALPFGRLGVAEV